MREDIIRQLEAEVLRRCASEQNHFGPGIRFHIQAVVKNAELLADTYGADKEIVIIAAWLHDIASVTDYKYYEEHHIYGAVIAGQLLDSMDYPKEKIKHVQECIRNHRGSVLCEKQSAEETCVADADAVSHFDSVPSLFYLAYVRHGYTMQEGIDFVTEKLKRSFAKLSSTGREFYQEKFLSVMSVINN